MSGTIVGEMERDHLCQGTPIGLLSGWSIPIEYMDKCNFKILTYNKNINGIVSGNKIDFLNRGIKPTVIKILFEDGTHILTGKEHPYLLHNEDDEKNSDNEIEDEKKEEDNWVKVKDLRIGDRIRTTVNFVCIDPYKEFEEYKNWYLDEKYLIDNYNINKFLNLEIDQLIPNKTNRINNVQKYMKILAICRIIGLAVTDGHISNTQILLFTGASLDMEAVHEDMELILNKKITSATKDGYNYTTCINPLLADFIRSLRGIYIGARKDNGYSIPEFLKDKNCPLPFIREFLAGIFGGDGHMPLLANRKDPKRKSNYLLSSVEISHSRVVSKMNELEQGLNDIKVLLERFGINDITLQKAKETSVSKKKYENEDKQYQIVLRIPLKRLVLFADKIGFRYCINKSLKLAFAVSYRRYRDNYERQFKQIVEYALELKSKYTIKESINKAYEKLVSEEYVYCDKPKSHQIKPTFKDNKYFRSENMLQVDEYFKQIGVFDLMQQTYITDGSYAITYNLKIVKIEEIKNTLPCYDIQVEDTENFIANGLVTHNCLIGHGASNFLWEKNFEQSDKFQIYVCDNCGFMASSTTECRLCKKDQISKVNFSYASKLLTQELQAMGIKTIMKITH